MSMRQLLNNCDYVPHEDRPNYFDVKKVHPMREIYRGRKLYLICGSSFPPTGKPSTAVFCLEDDRESKLYHNDKHEFEIEGKWFKYGANLSASNSYLNQFQTAQIKPMCSKNHAIREGSILRILKQYEDDYLLVRMDETGCFYNIHRGDLFLETQISLFT